MHIHILGIAGTFMTGVALLAKGLRHRVEGTDANMYPPMSNVLEAHKIKVYEGYDTAHLKKNTPDLVLIGNVVSRGNPMVEHVLAHNIPFASAPEWLAREVLRERWVLAVAGTHGKTTTAALLAWIMERAGQTPGFLIGGDPVGFDVPARLGEGPFFVIEADEYDTAFFDKRPKFMHYHPLTLALNNLEYDHADIFADLGEIQKQFQYLLRTVPSTGRVVMPGDCEPLSTVLKGGCWSEVMYFYVGEQRHKQGCWTGRLLSSDGTHYEICTPEGKRTELSWSLMGQHNVCNALVATACAHHAGVDLDTIVGALECFAGVRRRLELLGNVGGVYIYEDFAHHPTAIASTLEALRTRVGKQRLVAVLELRSNTMRAGVHKDALKQATATADRVLWLEPGRLKWDFNKAVAAPNTSLHASTDEMLELLTEQLREGDHVVLMTNGDFESLQHRVLAGLEAREKLARH